MVGALLESQKEEDLAKQGGSKVLVTSEKNEEKNPKKSGKKPGPSFVKTEPRRREGQRFAPEGQRFTPLNTSVSEVFMEIIRDPAFRWPTWMKAKPNKHDRTKFCEYHGDYGHLVEECIILS
jgi:hypothetical protein